MDFTNLAPLAACWQTSRKLVSIETTKWGVYKCLLLQHRGVS